MKTALEQLHSLWFDAWLRKDVGVVEKHMANEYVYIAPNGQLIERARILEIINSPTYKLYNGISTEVIIKPLGNDAAAIVHRWRGSGTFDGKSFTEDHRCTMVCIRDAGEWRVVLEQCSAISEA